MELQSGNTLSAVLEADWLIGLWRLPITHALFLQIFAIIAIHTVAQALS